MSKARAIPLAAIAAGALFVVAFVTSLGPWLTRDRPFVSSTPTSLSTIALTDLRLPHRAVLCVRGFGLDSTANGLQFLVHDAAQVGATPPLRIVVRATGYRSVARLAAGYPFGAPVVVPIRPPTRDVEDARACIRNEGKAIALVSTVVSRELARVSVRIDGRKVVPQPWLTFVQIPPASVLDRPGEILDRVAAFRPFPAVPLLLGVLAVLAILGVPLAVVGALALADRTDTRDHA
ncbi:MAG: hypothetical protein QOJ63_3486 [Solirubrobacteraceae bacterium]|jgi:hypothetical protein|nr:hypothetical protein [Solirubrobacteraceae bacterium]